MISLESRLAAIVALLPAQEQPRFTAPLTLGESADSRLVDAVRALAKREGLMFLTPGEFSRALFQQAARRAMPATKPPAAGVAGPRRPRPPRR